MNKKKRENDAFLDGSNISSHAFLIYTVICLREYIGNTYFLSNSNPNLVINFFNKPK